MSAGWDAPGPRRGASAYAPYTWHWYDGARPICGTEARLSRVQLRRAALPDIARRVCKRCRKKLTTEGA